MGVIMKLRFITLLAACLVLSGMALAEEHRNPAPDGARAYIVAPADGATLSSPVTIVFGLEGMGVAPAGTERENTGHHHLLIDTDPDTLDLDTSLPATDQIVHFGGGQTQVTIDLPPGSHRLQLLLGDWNHVPHDPPVMSEIVSVTVE
jgi:hypothetical protein